jgi:hypothetical protein
MNTANHRFTICCAALVCIACLHLGTTSVPGDPPPGDADALRLRLSREMVEQTRPPVGSVLAYWCSKSDADKLESYELCDGSLVKTAGSPLFGKAKPDLRNHFCMGYDGAADLREHAVSGGTNETAAIKLGRTGGTALTVAQMPTHSHPHQHYVATCKEEGGRYACDHRQETIVTAGKAGADSKYSLQTARDAADSGVTNRDSTPAGGGEVHDHTLPDVPAQDNRPAFVAMYYIMRVK